MNTNYMVTKSVIIQDSSSIRLICHGHKLYSHRSDAAFTQPRTRTYFSRSSSIHDGTRLLALPPVHISLGWISIWSINQFIDQSLGISILNATSSLSTFCRCYPYSSAFQFDFNPSSTLETHPNLNRSQSRCYSRWFNRSNTFNLIRATHSTRSISHPTCYRFDQSHSNSTFSRYQLLLSHLKPSSDLSSWGGVLRIQPQGFN